MAGAAPSGWSGCLARLSRSSAAELARELALPCAAARRLEASFRLGRAVERAELPDHPLLDRPENVVRLLEPETRGRRQECFHALYVDARHRLLERRLISIGTLNASLVHPREVVGPALRVGAAAFVVAHNHPSGDPEPSAEDRAVTERLGRVGELIGIPLLDHVVLGRPGYVSLRRRGLLPRAAQPEPDPIGDESRESRGRTVRSPAARG